MANSNLIEIFQVEELEERLENSWRTCHCPVEHVNSVTGVIETEYKECPCETEWKAPSQY